MAAEEGRRREVGVAGYVGAAWELVDTWVVVVSSGHAGQKDVAPTREGVVLAPRRARAPYVGTH